MMTVNIHHADKGTQPFAAEAVTLPSAHALRVKPGDVFGYSDTVTLFFPLSLSLAQVQAIADAINAAAKPALAEVA